MAITCRKYHAYGYKCALNTEKSLLSIKLILWPETYQVLKMSFLILYYSEFLKTLTKISTAFKSLQVCPDLCF